MRRAGAECEGAVWGGLGALGTPHTAHRTFPSGKSGVAVGLFSENSPLDCFLQNARPPGLRPSEVRHLPPAHRNGPSACSGVAHGLFSINSPQDCSFRNAHASGLRPSEGQSIGLFMEKRSCSRAAPLRVNPQGGGFWAVWGGWGAGGSSSYAARLLHLARTETPGVGSRFPSRKP